MKGVYTHAGKIIIDILHHSSSSSGHSRNFDLIYLYHHPNDPTISIIVIVVSTVSKTSTVSTTSTTLIATIVSTASTTSTAKLFL